MLHLICQAYGTFTASPTDVNEGMPIANATSTCSGDGPFAITSNTAPELDGCYVDTGATDVGGSILYTVSGTTTMAEIYLFSRQYDDGNVSHDYTVNCSMPALTLMKILFHVLQSHGSYRGCI